MARSPTEIDDDRRPSPALDEWSTEKSAAASFMNSAQIGTASLAPVALIEGAGRLRSRLPFRSWGV